MDGERFNHLNIHANINAHWDFACASRFLSTASVNTDALSARSLGVDTLTTLHRYKAVIALVLRSIACSLLQVAAVPKNLLFSPCLIGGTRNLGVVDAGGGRARYPRIPSLCIILTRFCFW